MPLRLCNPR